MEQMDKLFVERARQGDESAFEALVNLYGKKVYNTACRICKNEADAEDVAQEVFLKVYRALPNFKGESSFSTFLYRVTVNACLDFVRRSGRAAAESLVRQDADGEEYEYLPADAEQTPERESERAELRERDAFDARGRVGRCAQVHGVRGEAEQVDLTAGRGQQFGAHRGEHVVRQARVVVQGFVELRVIGQFGESGRPRCGLAREHERVRFAGKAAEEWCGGHQCSFCVSHM